MSSFKNFEVKLVYYFLILNGFDNDSLKTPNNFNNL
jgi:hypothetical protein